MHQNKFRGIIYFAIIEASDSYSELFVEFKYSDFIYSARN